MKNSIVLDNLVMCKGYTYNSDLKEKVDNSPIDLRYWLKKSTKYSIDESITANIILDIISNSKDTDKWFMSCYENIFDFMLGTFTARRKYNDSNWGPLEEKLQHIANTHSIMDMVIRYHLTFGKEAFIDSERYKMLHDGKGRLDFRSDKYTYEKVAGIEFDIVTKKIEVICYKGKLSVLSNIQEREEGKLKIPFVNTTDYYYIFW